MKLMGMLISDFEVYMNVTGAGGNNVKAMPTITKFDKRDLPEGERGLYDTDLDAFESVLNIERKR